MVTFASTQEAITATDKWLYRIVRIGQIAQAAFDVTTTHRVDRPTASATVVVEAPLRSYVREGSTVEIIAGYPGVSARMFHGYATTLNSRLDSSGRYATITAKGWCNLLNDRPERTLRWNGPIDLKHIVISLLNHFRVPQYLVDDITYDNGTPIRLGVNSLVSDGEVVIDTGTNALSWLTQTLGLFGYAIYDTPIGEVRVKRISGLPVGDPVVTVQQGDIGYRYDRQRTSDGMANYWRVTGASYTDEDGVQQQIVSIPATVTPHIAFRGKQIRKLDRSSGIIETQAMADLVRNVLERDYGVPIAEVSAQVDLAPLVNPGDVAKVTSPVVQAEDDVWITAIDHRMPRQGMMTSTIRGTRGNGTALPAGNDCITLPLQTAPVHLGDERVPWYAVPNPSGREISIPFTVSNNYTSMKIVGLGHGCNSYLIGNESVDAGVSRFVIQQNGEEISSGDLPVLPENYNERLPYGASDEHWGRFVVPMPGQIKPGQATLKIISGEDTRLPAHTRWDDFEVKSIHLIACGVGQPEIVGGEAT